MSVMIAGQSAAAISGARASAGAAFALAAFGPTLDPAVAPAADVLLSFLDIFDPALEVEPSPGVLCIVLLRSLSMHKLGHETCPGADMTGRSRSSILNFELNSGVQDYEK